MLGDVIISEKKKADLKKSSVRALERKGAGAKEREAKSRKQRAVSIKQTFKNIPIVIAIVIVSLALASGCGGSAKSTSTKNISSKPINVAAASSFQTAFQNLAQGFTDETGIKIDFNFGSSGLLARQIEEGAPVDIYASASKKYVSDLKKQGLISTEKSVTVSGQLVLIFSEFTEKSLFDLVSTDIEKIAIANPEHAPYGEAAKKVLKNAGLWDSVKDKIVYGNNIVQTTQFVSSKNADAGLISISHAAASGFEFEVIDKDLYDPIEQPIVIVEESTNKDAAAKFISYLSEGEGRQKLGAYGFKVDDE